VNRSADDRRTVLVSPLLGLHLGDLASWMVHYVVARGPLDRPMRDRKNTSKKRKNELFW